MPREITIPREEMRSILWGDSDHGQVIEDTLTGNDRWSIYHDLIFSYQGNTYRTSYSEGATEMQDEAPFEYEDEITCVEVRKVLKLMDVWEADSDDGQI